MLKAIFFDLDGTLLPMDQEQFTRGYFKALAGKLSRHGYDPKQLVDAVWSGTAAMVRNDGSCTNEHVFWNAFAELIGPRVYDDRPLFDAFYATDFNTLQSLCGHNLQAAECVKEFKQRGISLILASNPVFPMTAQINRMNWAGIDEADFELVTSYENSRYCKPNPDYYRDLIEKAGFAPAECLMVGNDVSEDMIAEEAGMRVFLLTNCLINKERRDISRYPRGNYQQLLQLAARENP